VQDKTPSPQPYLTATFVEVRLGFQVHHHLVPPFRGAKLPLVAANHAVGRPLDATFVEAPLLSQVYHPAPLVLRAEILLAAVIHAK